MPSGGVGLRKLTSFAPTGHERLVVVKYERDSEEELLRSLQRAEALKEFCKTNPHDFHSSYDVLLNNCQHFASLCRTGSTRSLEVPSMPSLSPSSSSVSSETCMYEGNTASKSGRMPAHTPPALEMAHVSVS
eukprot:gene3721-13787_t